MPRSFWKSLQFRSILKTPELLWMIAFIATLAIALFLGLLAGPWPIQDVDRTTSADIKKAIASTPWIPSLCYGKSSEPLFQELAVIEFGHIIRSLDKLRNCSGRLKGMSQATVPLRHNISRLRTFVDDLDPFSEVTRRSKPLVDSLVSAGDELSKNLDNLRRKEFYLRYKISSGLQMLVKLADVRLTSESNRYGFFTALDFAVHLLLPPILKTSHHGHFIAAQATFLYRRVRHSGAVIKDMDKTLTILELVKEKLSQMEMILEQESGSGGAICGKMLEGKRTWTWSNIASTRSCGRELKAVKTTMSFAITHLSSFISTIAGMRLQLEVIHESLERVYSEMSRYFSFVVVYSREYGPLEPYDMTKVSMGSTSYCSVWVAISYIIPSLEAVDSRFKATVNFGPEMMR